MVTFNEFNKQIAEAEAALQLQRRLMLTAGVMIMVGAHGKLAHIAHEQALRGVKVGLELQCEDGGGAWTLSVTTMCCWMRVRWSMAQPEYALISGTNMLKPLPESNIIMDFDRMDASASEICLELVAHMKLVARKGGR
jgi:hypothetical protein